MTAPAKPPAHSWFGESANQSLFACVYVPEFPAQALVRLRPALKTKCVAVLEGAPPHERVCAGNAQARRDGLRNGMTRVEAESFGGMVALGRSLGEEERARAALLSCVGGFTPRAEACHTDAAAVCVLDVAGMGRLYPNPQTFARALRHALSARGLHASVAISANFHAARALARSTRAITVAPPSEERRALAPLLLHVLDLSEEQKQTLALWGIGTLGGLAALPQKELIARMGQSGKRLHELALGEHPHLFAPAPVVWELKEDLAFEGGPVRSLESILFALSPMLDQLLAQARERALALAAVTVTFALGARALDPEDDGRLDPELDSRASAPGMHLVAPRNEADSGAGHVVIHGAMHGSAIVMRSAPAIHHRRTVRPSLPTQNKRLLLKLLQLDLAAHPPSAAVLAVTLEAIAAKTGAVQDGLFAPPLPEASRLDVTLARLGALVGEGRVGSPALRDTHAPDSFSVGLFKNELAAAAACSANAAPAMRQLRPPEPATVHTEAAHPVQFFFRGELYEVRSLCGPWRSSGDWWSTAAWAYEYWEVVGSRPVKSISASAQPARQPFLVPAPAPVPARLCCRLRRSLENGAGQWCVEALYD